MDVQSTSRPFNSACVLCFGLFATFINVFPTLAQGPRRGFPDLAEAVSSFGAAVCGDYLYVYSGHTGKAHAHSRENLSASFQRLPLKTQGDWDPLPMQQTLQGLALVPWQGRLYRVGGVHSRNEPNEPEDMHSTATVARFDPVAKTWTELTPLPEARSSLDAAVLDGKLYVLGGWTLAGDSVEAQWGERYYVADLNQDPLQWQALPPAPFKHRALAVAATQQRVYAIGGMNHKNRTTQQVYAYDPATAVWSKEPNIPIVTGLKGFGASAFGVDNTIWASGYDGKVYALDEGAEQWRDTDYALETKRFFHRLLAHPEDKLLFLGGANRKGYQASIEIVDITTLNAISATNVRTLNDQSTGQTHVPTGQTHWPGFRGQGQSQCQARDLPVSWSDSENLAWSQELAGYGQSSPVIWGDRVFVTTVQGEKKETLTVTCYNLRNGKQHWQRDFPTSVPQKNSRSVSRAAPTPVVDSEHLYVFFESGDLFALDHEGSQLWQRSLTQDYGDFTGNHGIGTSPALSHHGIVLLIDHGGPSYLLTLNKDNGQTLWRNERESRTSWSTPLVVSQAGGQAIIISSNGIVESYDVQNGQRHWYYEDVEKNTIASPSLTDDLVIIGTSHKSYMAAIKRHGQGNITATHQAWLAEKATSGFGSPLVHKDCVYYVNRGGIAFCNDLDTGKLNWSLRLPDACWASPMAVGDLIYFCGKKGITTVLQANAQEPIQVAESKIDTKETLYGVAAVDRHLLLRFGPRLLCLRKGAIAAQSNRPDSVSLP